MKSVLKAAGSLVVLAALAFADVNGKFVGERETQRGKVVQTFDLKSSGNKLAGTVTMQFGDMEPRTVEIQDGKVNGNKVSFSTVMQTPNGDFKMVYEATVDGDTMKGTAGREGGDGRPFEAKKK